MQFLNSSMVMYVHSSMILAFLLAVSLYCQAQPKRWKINSNSSIVWNIDSRLPHNDYIEMAGEQASAIINYGVMERMLLSPPELLYDQC